MIHEFIRARFTARRAVGALTFAAALTLLCSAGCRNQAMAPASLGSTTIVGTLVEIKDGRAYDGGIDLTLETTKGVRELARVPSLFRVPPREWVSAMHKVVDESKLGDRMRARGKRDASGALNVETLENVTPR